MVKRKKKEVEKDGLIDDPLKWQKEMDFYGRTAGMNLKGAGRFWDTVEDLLMREVKVNDPLEVSEIIIELNEEIGLKLSTEDNWPYIDYQFIKMEEKDDN